MSTRWYPIYQRGGPQLRVFLPNFWMKLIQPSHEQPPNVVQFACSMEMTQHDVKSYLEKIYNINVINVRTRIAMGPTKRDQVQGYVTKTDDTKLAYVTLPKDVEFKYPDIFHKADTTKKDSDDKAMEESKKGYKQYLERNKNRPGLPGWYSI